VVALINRAAVEAVLGATAVLVVLVAVAVVVMVLMALLEPLAAELVEVMLAIPGVLEVVLVCLG
jgi:hypothetical protein